MKRISVEIDDDVYDEMKQELLRRATHAFTCLNQLREIEAEIRTDLLDIKKRLLEFDPENDPDLTQLHETLKRIK